MFNENLDNLYLSPHIETVVNSKKLTASLNNTLKKRTLKWNDGESSTYERD